MLDDVDKFLSEQHQLELRRQDLIKEVLKSVALPHRKSPQDSEFGAIRAQYANPAAASIYMDLA
jgi:hypothetical protein